MKTCKIVLFLGLIISIHSACGESKPSQLNNDETSDTSNPAIVTDLSSIKVHPGDSILLQSGKVYYGSIKLHGIKSDAKPVIIRSTSDEPAVIDAAGELAGIELTNCSGFTIQNLKIVADGHNGKTKKEDPGTPSKMRCGILVKAAKPGKFTHFKIEQVQIEDVHYEDKGFIRGTSDTHTANGNEAYGYGIRFISSLENAILDDIRISECNITNVSHTGIKFTAKLGAMNNIEIDSNKVIHVGGPGIQMSGVQDVKVHHNKVDHSGSVNDSRNWKRGSGYWCWGAKNILLEHNSFTHAHGPMDSAGAHIDFNCSDIIYQYNFSAWNAGGFVEILGNNWNCCYRYNISVDDGYRSKGDTKGCHDGKTLWLSGYVGKGNKPYGPCFSYIYNNTIYASNKIQSKIAFERSTEGALITNNIFYVVGNSKNVANSQPSDVAPERRNINFTNNLYLHENTLPEDFSDQSPIYGDPGFVNKDGLTPESFVPTNKQLITKGVSVIRLKFDEVGLKVGFDIEKDFFGNKITEPIIGAVIPQ